MTFSVCPAQPCGLVAHASPPSWPVGIAAILASTLTFFGLVWTAQPVAAQEQFIQQGPKLVGTGAVAGGCCGAEQGTSAALSADGNTAIVGGYFDSGQDGAVWVFTRSDGVWNQQGGKLVGNGTVNSTPTTGARQGWSVALSGDGNTAIIGGPGDSESLGAAWVFTRSGGVWTQQGAKLVGTGAIGNSQQGASVALSADGNTAVVGGPADNGGIGATWVWTQSGGVWTQQGAKLIGTGATNAAAQGTSASLSADGNTLIVGGPQDNNTTPYGPVGAVWFFARSGGVWTQQGPALVGTGAVAGICCGAEEGNSVALSGDGSTAVVGGYGDNGGVGATWVFTQTSSLWTQQGSKLIGTGGVRASGADFGGQGTSVALSSDGNTLIEGAFNDNTYDGAAWAFTRSAGVWTQQGAKLVGTGAANPARQGTSVAMSGDGNTAAVGGPYDSNTNGATWVFVQEQPPTPPTVTAIAPTSGAGGTSVSITGTNFTGATAVNFGSTAAVSFTINNATSITATAPPGSATADVTVTTPEGTSATSTADRFTYPRAAHDFNGDGTSDIAWRDTSGDVAIWLMSGAQLSQSATLGNVPTVWSIVGQRDFNGDGDADILWLDSSGDLAAWLMNSTEVISSISLGNVGTQWSVAGTGDFNHDGVGDVLWRNTSTGDVAIWLMSNGQFSSGVDLGVVPLAWTVAGTGDFNGDGTVDILWRNTSTGDLAIWLMSNGQFSSGVDLGAVPLTWTVVGTGDFNGDGTTDILWRDTSGNLAIWLMSDGQLSSGATIAQVPSTWSVAETGDFNGDGMSDILWLDTSGDLAVWLMNGTSLSSGVSLGNVGTSWQVQGQNTD